MGDFGARAKAAEREVRKKPTTPEKRKRTPPATGRWKKGESGNPATQFKPGSCPNPGGRPKDVLAQHLRDVRDELYSGKEKRFKGMSWGRVWAIRQFELADDGDMMAIKEIADRSEGKVPQKSEHGGPGGGAIPFVNLTPEENELAIAAILAEAGDAGAGE